MPASYAWQPWTFFAFLIFNFSFAAFAQGALTPPGAPAPTMRTLAQIEPRTPISSAPFTIAQPGSYYLTTNVSANGNAIVITANGVSLDLGGWTISSTATNAALGGSAILLAGFLKNVTIQNGFIQGGVTNNGSGGFSGSGFGSGINYSVSPPVNVLVSKVSVSGCLTYGIALNIGESTVVESCTVRTIGTYGIYASTVKGCAAVDCGSEAIYGDQVTDCRGESFGSMGIYATMAQNCYGQCTSGGRGIYATTAHNCYGRCIGGGTGLEVSDIATSCRGESNGVGLAANIADSCHGIGAINLVVAHNVNSF